MDGAVPSVNWEEYRRRSSPEPKLIGKLVGDGVPYGYKNNPLLEPCPKCGSKRYQRCYKLVKADPKGGADFWIDLEQPHRERVVRE